MDSGKPQAGGTPQRAGNANSRPAGADPGQAPPKAPVPVPTFVLEEAHLSQGFLSNLKDFFLQRAVPVPRGRGPGSAGGQVRVPTLVVEEAHLSQGFFSNLRDFLLERPIKVPRGRVPGSIEGAEFGGGFWENVKLFFQSLPPQVRDARSRMNVEWTPWYRIFWENVRDIIAPPKLPPLKVSGPPVKVRDIWSKNEQFSRAQTLSLAFHALVAVLVLVPIVRHVTEGQMQTVKADVNVIDISPYLPQLPPGKDKAGGGGGGGERNPNPPTKGRLPKFSMTQLTPPLAVIRNLNPKLPAQPTVVVPPEIRIPNPSLPNYGDPLAALITDSGGPGGGAGIGTGCCGGVGSGEGPGVGPGHGGGIGGGAFRAGSGGVGFPQCLYCPNPTYTEEARKAKYQGTVLLRAIITADGRATNIEVIKGLGLGLDERAVEAVRTWRFKPALGPDGRAVPAWTPIEINFRIY